MIGSKGERKAVFSYKKIKSRFQNVKKPSQSRGRVLNNIFTAIWAKASCWNISVFLFHVIEFQQGQCNTQLWSLGTSLHFLSIGKQIQFVQLKSINGMEWSMGLRVILDQLLIDSIHHELFNDFLFTNDFFGKSKMVVWRNLSGKVYRWYFMNTLLVDCALCGQFNCAISHNDCPENSIKNFSVHETIDGSGFVQLSSCNLLTFG